MTAILRRSQNTKPAPRPRRVVPYITGDTLIELYDIDWATYMRLDKQMEGTGTRFTFFEGRLDIMTLSTDHESIKGNLGHLIAAHCFAEEIDFLTEGSATRRIAGKQGKEPDDSFIFGTASKAIPDLVIEVALTSGGIDKLEFYSQLKIPEVWIWQITGLAAWAFDGKGYKKIRKSRLLPKFNLTLAGELAAWPTTSKAVKEYRKRMAKKK